VSSGTRPKNRVPARQLGIASFFALLIGLLLLVPNLPLTPTPAAQEVSQPPASAVPAKRDERTLLFVGDIMLSRAVGARMQAEKDWAYPFEKIAGALRAADLTIGNLECPVSDQGKNQYHLYSFRADPKALGGLNEAGFGVVSLANNHMYDWGAPALLDTVRRVREAGVRTVGAGQNDLEAHYPLVVDLAGVRLAFLAYVDVEPKDATAGPDRPGVAWLEAERVVADIRFARSLADVLVVLPHWGIEYAKLPSRNQVALAHQMIDAGADLVIGSHPHVVQPVEPYHSRWIAYSLGNFVFDQKDSATHKGLMLKVTLHGKQVGDLMMIPISINPRFQPEVATERETAAPRTQSRPKAESAPVRGKTQSLQSPVPASPVKSTDLKP
jgi:poly-gamma-glutamate capsule biosynthesis protein CapA/YwtB (metallophosphatase superfamily)